MDGYVSKPLRVGELFQVLASLLPRTDTTPQAPPEPARTLPPALEGALEAVGGDVALLEKVVDLFLEQSPELVARLRKAIDDGDGTAAAAAAHTLGGSLAVLAAGPAWDAARRVEQLGAAGDHAALGPACGALERELEGLLRMLDLAFPPPRLAKSA
jgi:two-component system, sensor histidine kinase and response regulator